MQMRMQMEPPPPWQLSRHAGKSSRSSFGRSPLNRFLRIIVQVFLCAVWSTTTTTSTSTDIRSSTAPYRLSGCRARLATFVGTTTMGVDAMGTTPKMLAVWASNGMTRTTRSTRNQALAMAAPSTASVAKNAPFDYVALYKPALMLTSLHDDEARSQRKHRPPRPTLLDLDNKLSERIHPINTTMLSYHVAGRLDRDSEGLLLLTNDGTFTATVCGSLHCHKRYWVGTRDRLTESQLDRLRHDGLVIRGRPTRPPISVQRLNATAAHTWLTNHNNEESTGQYGRAARHWLEIVLNQGRNRQIRRMTTAVGHRTVRLVRVGIGNLHLFPTIHNNNHDDDNDAEVALDPTMTCLQLQPGEWQQIGANDVLGPPCKRPPL